MARISRISRIVVFEELPRNGVMAASAFIGGFACAFGMGNLDILPNDFFFAKKEMESGKADKYGGGRGSEQNCCIYM